jgi:hypothetical protein
VTEPAASPDRRGRPSRASELPLARDGDVGKIISLSCVDSSVLEPVLGGGLRPPEQRPVTAEDDERVERLCRSIHAEPRRSSWSATVASGRHHGTVPFSSAADSRIAGCQRSSDTVQSRQSRSSEIAVGTSGVAIAPKPTTMPARDSLNW